VRTMYEGNQYTSSVRVIGDSLVFTNAEPVWQEPIHATQCWEYIYTNADCFGEEGCTYLVGQRACYEINGNPEVCIGGFATCTDHADADPSCVPLPESATPESLSGYCYSSDQYPVTSRYSFKVLDLSDPTDPKVGGVVQTPVEEDGVRLLDDGDSLYVTVKKSVAVPLDARPYAQYFVRRLDVTNPASPVLGPAINVPGELVAKKGSVLFTQDKLWGQQFVDSGIAKLELSGDLAHLQNYEHLPFRRVNSFGVDEGGLPVAVHGLQWQPHGGTYPAFSVFAPRPDGDDFVALSTTRLPTYLWLQHVERKRAFLSTYNGVLMVNLDAPETPFAQAFFKTWYYGGSNGPRIIDDEVYLPAGPSGIQQLGIDASNLLQTP